MNIEDIREYCLGKAQAVEAFPFGDDTLVFKVVMINGKSPMFALISLDKPNYILLKCEPEQAIELREKYREIEPGFHMNKRHWNGVFIDGSLTDEQIWRMIDESYRLVRGKK